MMCSMIRPTEGLTNTGNTELTMLDDVLFSFPQVWSWMWQNPTRACCNICGAPVEELDTLTRVLRPSEFDSGMLEASWECYRCSTMNDTWPVIVAKLRGTRFGTIRQRDILKS